MDLTIITSHLTDIFVTGFVVKVVVFLLHNCDDLVLFVSDFISHGVDRIRFSESQCSGYEWWSLGRLHHRLVVLNSFVSPLGVLDNLVKVVIELLLFLRLAQKLLWDEAAVCQSLLILLCHLLHAVVLHDDIERF